jgi:FHS family L-fucose permease-like MFS transporter
MISLTVPAAYFGIGYFAYSPVAAEILKRKGYKVAIISGLGLYSLGAILFWPVAHFSIGTSNPGGIFAGFVVCTAVIACGLATLEVAANSYVTVMPPHNIAGLRLQFSQSKPVFAFVGQSLTTRFQRCCILHWSFDRLQVLLQWRTRR